MRQFAARERPRRQRSTTDPLPGMDQRHRSALALAPIVRLLLRSARPQCRLAPQNGRR